MKMKSLIAFLIILLLLIIQSCDTTEPPPDDKPGRRDYVWTIDTLQIPEGRSHPALMWGVNADNIWAIGTAYANAYQIWHYNGIRWNNYVPDRYIDPRGICGFNENNIWTSSLGTNSLPAAFWHYNGSEWSKFSDISIQGYNNVVIQSIAGSSYNNIYAVGFADSIDGQTYKAIIFHFNGTLWSQENIPNIRNTFIQIFYDQVSGKFLITGWTFDTIDQFLYSYDGNRIQNIFSTQDGVILCSIHQSIYANVSSKLFKFNNGSFEMFKDFNSTNYTGNAWGRSEKDFFTVNSDGIGHYNGTDLITIYKKLNSDWFPGGGIVFEKEGFFIWEDSFSTFIIHGELKD